MKPMAASPGTDVGPGAPAAELLRRLPPDVAARTAAVAGAAERAGVAAYLVGGLVRDLLLGRQGRDLDIVVEGDGPAFARRLAAELGGQALVHEAFLTAEVVDGSGFHLDVVTARSEIYSAPAALPEVRMAALREDLFRRDFSVNAMAIRLTPSAEAGEEAALIDLFGGRGDLAERTLRVLHGRSFHDDPTRALRGIRLGLRLDLRMAPETERLIGEALAAGAFARLSGARLRDELILLLDDADLALRGIDRLAELGLLAVLHPSLELSRATRDRLRRVHAALESQRSAISAAPTAQPWRLFLAAVALPLAAAEVAALADRLDLVGADRRLLLGAAVRLAAARQAVERPAVLPHEVEEALAPLSAEELLLLVADGGEAAASWVRRYRDELRPLTLAVRGADLLAAGVRPGPAVGRTLAAVRRARLDGLIEREGELAFALAELSADELGKAKAS